MDSFQTLRGVAVPLDRSNVDTDTFIPKQFLKSIKRSGFGGNVFDEWRYLDHGEPGADVTGRPLNRDFILNQDRYQSPQILLARDNFGCGSSREHAVWALRDYGIRVLIAPSFADIFYNNCFKNGLLPVILDNQQVDQLFSETFRNEVYTLTVELEKQIVLTPLGQSFSFDIDAGRKQRLLNGLDDIDLTLQYDDEIKAYEERTRVEFPRLFQDITQ